MTIDYELSRKSIVASDAFGPAALPATIAGGAYAAGTILGRITASGKLTAYAAGANDGSQNPVAVLLEDADASGGDVQAVVGFAGVYVKKNMTGLDAAAVDKLEARGLYFA